MMLSMTNSRWDTKQGFLAFLLFYHSEFTHLTDFKCVEGLILYSQLSIHFSVLKVLFAVSCRLLDDLHSAGEIKFNNKYNTGVAMDNIQAMLNSKGKTLSSIFLRNYFSLCLPKF